VEELHSQLDVGVAGIQTKLLLVHNLLFCLSTVIPASYIYSTAEVESVNGSSATGHCSNVTNSTSTCENPASSVLFDEKIPTLTGLDGDMWASQLLTARPASGTTEISFDFSNHPNFIVRRVEVVIFNCPQINQMTAVQRIELHEGLSSFSSLISATNPNTTSSDSLVRVCLPNAVTTIPRLTLRLTLTPTSDCPLPLLASEGGDQGCGVWLTHLKRHVALIVLDVNAGTLLNQEACYGDTGAGRTVFRQMGTFTNLGRNKEISLTCNYIESEH